MRGQQKFFNNFNTSDEPPVKQTKRGRSSALHAERNTLLIYRYYYYLKLPQPKALKTKNYPEVLARIEQEFFLSEARIVDVLDENYADFKVVVTAAPTAEVLKEKYPHLVW